MKGVIEQLSGDVFGTGMDIIVSGNVPAASGLSSSSALVSAAVLATSHCYQVTFLNLISLFANIYFNLLNKLVYKIFSSH